MRKHNLIGERAAAIAKAAKRSGKIVIVENPLLSILWLTPWFQKLGGAEGFCEAKLHQCRYDAESMKPTKFLISRAHASFPDRRCGRQDGICGRTGKPHVPLSGFDGTGKFRTKKAAAFPFLAQALITYVVAVASMTA